MIKTIFCTGALLLLTFTKGQAQEKTTPGKHYYVVLYTLGESWDTTKAFHEQKYFSEHAAYLGQLRKNKSIVTGGRYSDTGLVILVAANETAAKELVQKDLAIQHHLFKAEVFLFEPFYSGCLNETP